jgi:hypothetical protein
MEHVSACHRLQHKHRAKLLAECAAREKKNQQPVVEKFTNNSIARQQLLLKLA